VRITDPTAVGDVNEVYDMDVINLDPKDFEYKQVNISPMSASGGKANLQLLMIRELKLL
jgi:hypothetical protein